MSTVTPDSTTAQLAKDAPAESKPVVPGTFPETPMNELDKEIKISPLPAAPGAINPIKLAPGEKIPEDLTKGDLNSNVKLDPESYEKADTLAGIDVNLPPPGKNTIPESSLPIEAANPTINTVTPQSTTAALAAKVPDEPRVPEVVKESQEKAGVDPEASGISEEVKEKEQVESELLSKVPEAPSTSEGTSGKGTEKSEKDKTLAETAAGLGAVAVATAIATKDKVVEQVNAAIPQAQAAASSAATNLPESVKQVLPASVLAAVNDTAKEETRQEVSPEVPVEVKESIMEAGKSPEAAANTEAVEEKKAVETELLKEVKPVEPAATTGETSSAKPATNGAEPAAKEPVAPAKEPETPSKPSTSTATESSPAATAERKKKNRLSAMFSKLKHKVSSKDKA